VPLRCAVVESNEDSMAALCAELCGGFALDCRPVFLPDRGPPPADGLRGADLAVTTPYHAGAVRPLAAETGIPLLAVTANPDIAPTVERTLGEGVVNAVIADPRFAERLRSAYAGTYGDRMRIVLADDPRALAELDPSEPVLLTEAARRRVGERLGTSRLVPHSPCISTESARELAELVIRLNAVRASRGHGTARDPGPVLAR
ncbi:MAG TPA: hypothetical protein VGV85_07410, partial [Longimicrobiaceae bacterium]|nr:hypothetical protein [Longimicrobiaceae bacterium]